jgi:hypothetical protein
MAFGSWSVIDGGCCNIITCGTGSIIGSGLLNKLSADYSVISGGINNTMEAISCLSSIVGGTLNFMQCVRGSSILGGESNAIVGIGTTIQRSVIVGGQSNAICCSGTHSAISGGYQNTLCNSSFSNIDGGSGNRISASSCANVNGGFCNAVFQSNSSSINGGNYNFVQLSNRSSIVGGFSNNIISRNDTFVIGSCISANRACTTFVNNLSIMDIPTSTVGLPAGSVWRDTNGFLRIV